jgi:hypothetical protein
MSNARKVKVALDENRLLILGVQMLFDFNQTLRAELASRLAQRQFLKDFIGTT